MKRDLLDDYKDFLITVKDHLIFELSPKRAFLDKDNNVIQENNIRTIIPGVGVTAGMGVIVFRPEMFPHGAYDEPCDWELIFDDIRVDQQQSIQPGNTLCDVPDSDMSIEQRNQEKSHPDPLLDDADIEWLNGLDF